MRDIVVHSGPAGFCKTVNVLIVGHDTFENRGCQALIYTTTEILKRFIPNAHFKVFSWDPDYDQLRFNKNGIPCEFLLHRFNTAKFSSRNRFWLFLNSELGIHTEKGLVVPKHFFNALRWADLIVVSGGDVLADYSEMAIKQYFFPMAVGMALGKPVYVFGQSISRYKNEKLKKFCKKYLDKAALITVREPLSYNYLKELGIKAPFYLTADPAFLLRPCAPERLEAMFREEGIRRDAEPRIGFSVSRTVTRWGASDHGDFVSGVASALDRLAERHKSARFLFVPHVSCLKDARKDDRMIGREIYERTSCKDRVDQVQGDYSCEELKAMIGSCDVFVGARTHSTIAALSQYVPTLALAYSIKAYGIMNQLLNEDVGVLSTRDFSADTLIQRIEDLYENKDRYAGQIKSRMPQIIEMALKNGSLAHSLL